MSRPTVAIIGASSNRSKYGNISLRAHIRQGYEVYPINPKGGEIEGIPVYKSLSDVPIQHFQRISMYVPPEVGITLLDEIATKECDEFWLNPGSDDDALIEAAREKGLAPIIACSIVDLGISPNDVN